MITRRIFNVPGWRSSNPFAELERMKQQMERLAEGYGRRRYERTGVFPAINLTENKESYIVRAELPGVNADDLDIQATFNSLSLSGERKIEAEGGSSKYHRREREAGKFSRIINLPDTVDPEKIEAGLVNGILTVTVPKSEAAKPRQIKIK